MKFAVIPVLFVGLLCGQQPPPTVAPAAPAAKPAVEVKPDTVVATVGGKPVTAGEVDRMVNAMPPPIQAAIKAQPDKYLQQLFVLRYMQEQAEKEGLDKKSPWKESLDYQRLTILASALTTERANTLVPTPADCEVHYKAHPELYQQAKVRVIYVAYNPTPEKPPANGAKLPAKAEAKAKIDDLRKKALASGGDFGQLAKANSDDKASAEKDGDFGTIKPSSAYPDPIKKAVFSLKVGEVSEPVEQPGGFYLIRVDELSTQPFADVAMQINDELRQDLKDKWMKGIQQQFPVKVENPAYFTPKPPGPPQPTR
jgi:peptidyl-prolyl cis-trans isomerase C